MTDTEPEGTEQLNNPMRFSVRNRTVAVGKYGVCVDKIEIKDGQMYVYWSEQ